MGVHIDLSSSSIERLVGDLVAVLGEDAVTVNDALREQHGGGETYHPVVPPGIVVFPTCTDDVVAIVERCSQYGAPIVAHGAGTALEGHLAALHGGVSVDMTRMNAILDVNVEDLDATVEAGVTRKQLEERLAPEGVFFSVDPGADATIGGMVATGATGTTTVRYGGMRENVLSLEVVTAAGDVLRTASRARKSAAGYDLTRLFVGSEGTLGIVTKATLRLHGIPEAIAAAVCPFPSIDAAVDCAMQTVQLGIPVARMELMDEVQMAATNELSKLAYDAAPTIFFEFHGSASSVEDNANEVAEIARELGAEEFQWSTDQEERAKLWEARHMAWYAFLAVRPGSKGFATDVCVPISQLADSIRAVRSDIDESGLIGAILGHVGDGNYHVVFLMDPADPSEFERAHEINERMVRDAIARDGTCTGEHGIGYGKIGFLELEQGPAGIDVMRAIKDALDPTGIMNPGKVLPDPAPRPA